MKGAGHCRKQLLLKSDSMLSRDFIKRKVHNLQNNTNTSIVLGNTHVSRGSLGVKVKPEYTVIGDLKWFHISLWIMIMFYCHVDGIVYGVRLVNNLVPDVSCSGLTRAQPSNSTSWKWKEKAAQWDPPSFPLLSPKFVQSKQARWESAAWLNII